MQRNILETGHHNPSVDETLDVNLGVQLVGLGLVRGQEGGQQQGDPQGAQGVDVGAGGERGGGREGGVGLGDARTAEVENRPGEEGYADADEA